MKFDIRDLYVMLLGICEFCESGCMGNFRLDVNEIIFAHAP